MRGKARGPWIEAALAGMRGSNRAAAAILPAHRSSACTDVSGFGLAGHLTEMVQASGVTASLVLDAVPLYEGAAALAAQGIGSSLLPENLKLGAASRPTERIAGDSICCSTRRPRADCSPACRPSMRRLA
jgi:selenide, water dikinase